MNRLRGMSCCAAFVLLAIIPNSSAMNMNSEQPLGSKCTTENQELAIQGNHGGTQMCVMTARGLKWVDSTNLAANSRMVKTLPKCGTSRIFKTTISSATTSILKRVAKEYFGSQQLAPIKIESIIAARVDLNSIGLHVCSNGLGAPLGGWTGSVPKVASGAWLLAVTHKKNAFGNFHFIYIAQLGNKFEVVGEGTGP